MPGLLHPILAHRFRVEYSNLDERYTNLSSSTIYADYDIGLKTITCAIDLSADGSVQDELTSFCARPYQIAIVYVDNDCSPMYTVQCTLNKDLISCRIGNNYVSNIKTIRAIISTGVV